MCSDISKCTGSRCANRDNCYRYTAPSSNYQSHVDPAECMRNNFALYCPIHDDKEIKTP